MRTSLLVRSIPLRFLDQDILDVLLTEMKQSGLEVLLNSPHKKVEKLLNGKLRVTLADGSFVEADKVL